MAERDAAKGKQEPERVISLSSQLDVENSAGRAMPHLKTEDSNNSRRKSTLNSLALSRGLANQLVLYSARSALLVRVRAGSMAINRIFTSLSHGERSVLQQLLAKEDDVLLAACAEFDDVRHWPCDAVFV
jgi:hypothetical protein